MSSYIHNKREEVLRLEIAALVISLLGLILEGIKTLRDRKPKQPARRSRKPGKHRR